MYFYKDRARKDKKVQESKSDPLSMELGGQKEKEKKLGVKCNSCLTEKRENQSPTLLTSGI